jgi:uncharacterized protein (TIGR02246 family)
MRFQAHFFLTILVFIALVGCAPATQEPAVQEASTEADVEAINALEKEFTAAFKRGDADAMASMMTDDTVLMLPNQPAIMGKEACRSFWQEVLTDEGTESHAVATEEVVVGGDWAFARATTRSVSRTEDGEVLESGGKYIHIMQRQSDGSWKLARDIWNSNSPPPDS